MRANSAAAKSGAAAERDRRVFTELSQPRQVCLELFAEVRSCGFVSAVQTLGTSERPVEVIVCVLGKDVGAPQQWPGGLRRSDGGSGITGEKMRLLAAKPVPAKGRGERRYPAAFVLKIGLVELGAVEGPETRRVPPQHPGQTQLRLDLEYGEIEIVLTRVVEGAPAGSFGLLEGRARNQHQLFDVVEKIGG